MKIFGLEFGKNEPKNDAKQVKDDHISEKNDLFKVFSEQQLYRVTQKIENWRTASKTAESVVFPMRTELLRTYQDVRLDTFLESVINVRKNAVLASRYVVKKNGEIDIDKTEQINAQWFRFFISECIESKMYGFSLVQFGDLVNGEFPNIKSVPREYVSPEKHIVKDNMYSLEGTDFYEDRFKNNVIFIGDEKSLGLLNLVSPLCIWKKFAFQNWGVYQSTFGLPIRTLKTDTKDPNTISSYKKMMANLSSSAWSIIKKDDELTMSESKNSDAFNVFDALIKRANREIALAIVNQPSTSDENAFVGAVEVQERIFKQLNLVDAWFLDDIFKKHLVPLLNLRGFGFEGCTICVEPDDAFTLVEKAKIDIALLNTKQFTIDPEYILKTYGTPVTFLGMAQKPGQQLLHPDINPADTNQIKVTEQPTPPSGAPQP